MMHRRRFLKQVSGGLIFLSTSRVLAAVKPQQRIRIGAQTNTWGAPIKSYDHLLEILDSLVRMGYEGFETNYLSLKEHAGTARQCRAAFESRHIVYVAPHCNVNFAAVADPLAQMEDLRRIAGESAAMGAKYLIASGSYPKNGGGTVPVEQKAKLLDQAGKVCREAGLKFCYHNHRHEFEGDQPEMDVFLTHTDPKLVWMNYDIGNAYPIGPKPGDFSAEHFRRILIYHIKDVTLDSNGKNVPTDLGAGRIDLRAVVAPLLKSNWQGWLVVERESGYPNAAANPESLLKDCRSYIREITGV